MEGIVFVYLAVIIYWFLLDHPRLDDLRNPSKRKIFNQFLFVCGELPPISSTYLWALIQLVLGFNFLWNVLFAFIGKLVIFDHYYLMHSDSYNISNDYLYVYSKKKDYIFACKHSAITNINSKIAWAFALIKTVLYSLLLVGRLKYKFFFVD